METRRPSDLSLPYGKLAMWGIAVSVVVTGALLLTVPWSPVQLAARAVDGRADLRGALLPDGRRLATAVEVGRRVVGEVLGSGRHGAGHHVEHRWVHEHAWIHVLPELGAELSREWSDLAPRVGAEIVREWTTIAPELREEVRRELRRELRGLRLEVGPPPPGIAVVGG